MRVLVCGGRDFGNISRHNPPTESELKEYRFILSTLTKELCPPVTDDMETWLPPKDLYIIAGGAWGVDSAAIDWAVVNWVQFKEYPADWDTYGKAAGAIRNKQMLTEGKPDLVLAFPGGRGTANMVGQAKKANIPVKEIKYEL